MIDKAVYICVIHLSFKVNKSNIKHTDITYSSAIYLLYDAIQQQAPKDQNNISD